MCEQAHKLWKSWLVYARQQYESCKNLPTTPPIRHAPKYVGVYGFVPISPAILAMHASAHLDSSACCRHSRDIFRPRRHVCLSCAVESKGVWEQHVSPGLHAAGMTSQAMNELVGSWHVQPRSYGSWSDVANLIWIQSISEFNGSERAPSALVQAYNADHKVELIG